VGGAVVELTAAAVNGDTASEFFLRAFPLEGLQGSSKDFTHSQIQTSCENNLFCP
jgi:hypothetical protein